MTKILIILSIIVMIFIFSYIMKVNNGTKYQNNNQGNSGKNDNNFNYKDISEIGDAKKALLKITTGQVKHIEIITTDQGPVKDDVFRKITTDDNEVIIISQTNENSKQILIESQKLNGFNNEEMINSMASAENKIFDLWPPIK